MGPCAAHARSQLIRLQIPFRLSSFTNADLRPIAAPETLADGSTYYGLLSSESESLPDGLGTHLSRDSTYSGEFCSGLRHGWGMCVRSSVGVAMYGHADGWLRYEGVWDNNTRHGFGYLRMDRGSKYFGQLQRNKRHGSALVILNDGREQVWRTLWKDNVCLSKCPLVLATADTQLTAEAEVCVENCEEACSQSSDEIPLTTSSSSFETPNAFLSKADLCSVGGFAAAFAAAGIDEGVCQIVTREQLNGRVIAILLRQAGLDAGLARSGISNPYTRRFCILILYALLSLKSNVGGGGGWIGERAAAAGESCTTGSPKISRSTSTAGLSGGASPELSIKNLYVERRIGEGGYGRVYRGRYDFGGGTKIPVACKVFRQSELWRTSNKSNPRLTLKGTGGNRTKQSATGNLSFVLGPNFYQGLREFESELANHRRLHHPNVVKLYGCIRHPLYSVISEYVPCGSLFDLLHRHRRKLNLTSWLKISEQIAYALSYLHSREIIHCDLKTSNILITQEGDVKICDFGLSHSLSEDALDCLAIGSIGTVQWMSPEALRGEALTTASDIYSLGIILWEILTGELPYSTTSTDHILSFVGYAGLSLMNSYISGAETNAPIMSLPPNVINVIKACLHPDPMRRPSAQKLNLFFQKGRQCKFLDFEQNIKTFFGL